MGVDHASHGTDVSTRGAHLRVQLINMKVSMRAVGRFPANNLGYVASEHDYIGARPFARKESESAKGPFKPQGGGLLQGNRSAEAEKIGTGEHQ